MHMDVVGATVANSQFMSSRKSSIPKASDRFVAPTEFVKAPAPDMYSPRQQIGNDVSSRQPKVPRTKFGKDRTDILDIHYSMKRAEENPGPGAHERFSDF